MIHPLIALLSALCMAQSNPLTAHPPILVPGGAGKFDFMNVDSKDRLAFACQPGKSAFVVIHLDSEKVKSVDVGAEINGIDSDSKGQKVYGAGPSKVLVKFDMATWKKAGSLNLDGPGDSVIFDSKHGTLYVDNDDGTSLWCVSPGSMKISKTVTIKEAPEVMVLDTSRNKIFQNIKTTNTVQVIDIASMSVVAEYKLGELTSPHGLAEDHAAGKLFSVGKNGKLVILNADSGKILQTLDVTKSSDQIAYDSQLKRLYIPGSGVIQTVQVYASGAEIIGSASLPKGCHSVTVDPQTHDVWVAYADDANSYVMKYSVR
jgi:DNA-binding beta-propeller fold protein YncE